MTTEADVSACDAGGAPNQPPAKTLNWSSYILIWSAAVAACALLATLLFWDQRETGETGGYFVIVCLYALVGTAALSDAALRKIPNRFNYTALLLALLLNLVIAPFCELLDWTTASQWIGANCGPLGGVSLEALKGFALCVVVGLISFAAKGLGGGDVKLLATVGVLAGWNLSVSILLNTLAVALIIGIVNLLLRGALIYNLQLCLLRVYLLIYERDIKTPVFFKRTESPFCLSLLIGLILLPYVNLHAQISAWLSAITGQSV